MIFAPNATNIGLLVVTDYRESDGACVGVFSARLHALLGGNPVPTEEFEISGSFRASCKAG